MNRTIPLTGPLIAGFFTSAESDLACLMTT